MILSFEVENYLSFQERQEVSFVASSLKDSEEGIIETDAFNERRVLPALLVYGANASGKTNLVRALDAMAWTVLYSHTREQPGGEIRSCQPFGLDPWSHERPTEFELNFIVDGVRFNFGFAMKDSVITQEWLYSFPHGSRRTLYEREQQEFSFGRHLKGRNALVADLTRPNSLFISAAAQNGHKMLTGIFDYFAALQFEQVPKFGGTTGGPLIKEEDEWSIDEEVVRYLEEINTGIIGYQNKNENPDDELLQFRRKMGMASKPRFDLRTEFRNERELDLAKEIELEHRAPDGSIYTLPLSMESDGTIRLLMALPRVFKCLRSGGVLIMDELDLSLHTHAAEKIIGMFCSRKYNQKGAQILATTHDTNLLQSTFLRRDQVWLVEKNLGGGSEVYPLTDFPTRGTDDLERGYLQGRYGAVP